MKSIGIIITLSLLSFGLYSQNIDVQIDQLMRELEQISIREQQLLSEVEDLKLARIRRDLKTLGLPKIEANETLIEHSAMTLVYDEEHEQAKWVAHMIVPEVIQGNVSRSNDFRPDPKVSSGSAVEADYFLKYLQPDSSFEYDGFGYDRGHLAPSADFRWSQLALSESYFYSNMSPQTPELNRGRWAELEGLMRAYMTNSPHTQLYVVTGPVLHKNLPKIDRSLNGVSIPEYYYKVILDKNQQRAIGFLFPNKECPYPVESYAVSVDSIETLTGLDFYHNLPDSQENLMEASDNVKLWLPESQKDDVRPIDPETLPKNCFNTVTARSFADTGDQISICGTVVSTRLTRNGHIFLNLDKKFPNQIFTVAIWKDSKVNFSYEPHIELEGREICVEGQVRLSQGTPTMELRNEKAVTFR